jgi:hypothetical protein
MVVKLNPRDLPERRACVLDPVPIRAPIDKDRRSGSAAVVEHFVVGLHVACHYKRSSPIHPTYLVPLIFSSLQEMLVLQGTCIVVVHVSSVIRSHAARYRCACCLGTCYSIHIVLLWDLWY